MSTAWYKPNRLPRKIRSWMSSLESPKNNNPLTMIRSIEVWETTCVVTNMNSSDRSNNKNNSSGRDPCQSQTPFSVLINPGNPSLSGVSKFAYFPVGGPEPPPSFEIGKDSHPIMGYVSTWGGMEVGNGMSFASNTVDGIVHQYGGKELQKACESALSNTSTGIGGFEFGLGKLGEGQAIHTPSVGSKLKEASGYDLLVHTVPPFVDQDYRFGAEDEEKIAICGGKEDGDTTRGCEEEIGKHNDFLLAECYHNSLRTAQAAMVLPSSTSSGLKIACPLLGAGCRGFSTERAIRIAATATTDWMMEAAKANTEASAKPTAAEARHTHAIANDDFDFDDGYNRNSTAGFPSPFSLFTGWLGGESDSSRELGGASHHSVTIAFGIPDGEIREQLIEAIDREMDFRMP